MAQHDYIISNGTGAAVRSDLNGALGATVSNNSGATEPAIMYAYQWWPDTTAGLLKQRNSANSAWITIGTLASTNLGLATLASPTFTGTVTAPTFTASTAVNIPLGSVGSPSLFFTGDPNTGLFSSGADQVAVSTGGVQRLGVSSAGLISIPGTLDVTSTATFNAVVTIGGLNAVSTTKAQDEESQIKVNAAFSVGTAGAVPFGIGPVIPPGMAFAGIGPDAYNPIHLASGSFC